MPRLASLRLGPHRACYRTVAVPVDPMTAALVLRLTRPRSDATIRTHLVLLVDGVEYRCTGQSSQAGRYVLQYNLLVRDEGRRVVRLGEVARWQYEAFAELELVQGTGDLERLIVTAEAAPAPAWRVHHSIGNIAASSAKEENGDGIMSFSHTRTAGSDPAAFVGGGATGQISAGLASATYAGNAMTELWDFQGGGGAALINTGYRLAGAAVPTGTQTVATTITSWTGSQDQALGVITMNGVDGTTPVGTESHDAGTVSPATVTVGSVGVDDLVVDNLVTAFAGAGPTIGADQTQRYTQDGLWAGSFYRGSSQLGSLGGVMSWTFTDRGWTLGAIAFKPLVVTVPDTGGAANPLIVSRLQQPMLGGVYF